MLLLAEVAQGVRGKVGSSCERRSGRRLRGAEPRPAELPGSFPVQSVNTILVEQIVLARSTGIEIGGLDPRGPLPGVFVARSARLSVLDHDGEIDSDLDKHDRRVGALLAIGVGHAERDGIADHLTLLSICRQRRGESISATEETIYAR